MGSNQFGTDEFIQFRREVETEPYICVNMGNGSMDEAQHCENWSLGNEVSGHWEIGHKGPKGYAALAYEFAKIMKKIDKISS